MSSSWSTVVDHARTHHATITLVQARELGVTRRQLTSWAHTGRLLHPAPGIYAIAGSPTTWRHDVAIAAGSSAGCASHRTAAALWELDGFPPRQIEVLVPYGLRRRRTSWIVHESRAIRSVDLDEVDGIPCTSVVRTLLDLAAVAHPFLVGQALDHACRRWPGMLDAVDRRHAELRRKGRGGCRLMSELLDERIGRSRYTDSGFEASVLRLVRSIGLPEPALQHTVRDGDFVAQLDLAWPTIKWAVECDSLAHHSGKRAHEWDRQRRRHLKRLGWDIVEVTYDDITLRRDETGRELLALHRQRAHSLLSDVRYRIGPEV
ncbi:MAG TPA: type IV toxin-antitoxin system AbiEi family antitoxin domain-containing protein [Acidimicrobiales bacterium]|jgi:very-short-patch-repair endonuclease|nr:type IV toxin-antitoxin system AbiEi family antitoxin domain-containing protein [Acidimicrobiales bacterium]